MGIALVRLPQFGTCDARLTVREPERESCVLAIIDMGEWRAAQHGKSQSARSASQGERPSTVRLASADCVARILARLTGQPEPGSVRGKVLVFAELSDELAMQYNPEVYQITE